MTGCLPPGAQDQPVTEAHALDQNQTRRRPFSPRSDTLSIEPNWPGLHPVFAELISLDLRSACLLGINTEGNSWDDKLFSDH